MSRSPRLIHPSSKLASSRMRVLVSGGVSAVIGGSMLLAVLAVFGGSAPVPTVAPVARAACAALPAGGGTDTLAVSLAAAGTYRVWVREMPASTTGTSFYLQLENGGICQDSMGGASLPVGAWSWVDYSNGQPGNVVSASLPGGTSTLVLAGQSAGLLIDKVELLSDAGCTPTGDGSNCTQGTVAAPAGGIGGGASPAPASSGNSTVSGVISLGSDQMLPGGASVKYYVDGKLVAGPNLDTTKLSNGKHTVTIVTTAADGNVTTQTQVIMVNNHKTLADMLTSAFAAHRGLDLGIAALLLLAPLGYGLDMRFKWVDRLKRWLQRRSSTPASSSDEPLKES